MTTIESLHIAYRLARVLASVSEPDGAVDIGSVRLVLVRIKDAATSMRNIRTKATQINKAADGIKADADNAEDAVLRLVEQAEKLLEITSAQAA